MCQAIAYRSSTCGHRWLTITKQCIPNIGFDTHPQHQFKTSTTLTGSTKFFKAAAHSCPSCDLKGQYNSNKTRMLLSTRGCLQLPFVAASIPMLTYRNLPWQVPFGGPTMVSNAFELRAQAFEMMPHGADVYTPFQQSVNAYVSPYQFPQPGVAFGGNSHYFGVTVFPTTGKRSRNLPIRLLQ